MVIFRTAEGKSGYHQAEALEEAVRFVERIRNEEAVDQARIFRLEEVLFEFRPYYRVALTGAGSVGSAEAPAEVEEAVDEQTDDQQPDGEASADGDTEVPEVAASSGGGRKGIFR